MHGRRPGAVRDREARRVNRDGRNAPDVGWIRAFGDRSVWSACPLESEAAAGACVLNASSASDSSSRFSCVYESVTS